MLVWRECNITCLLNWKDPKKCSRKWIRELIVKNNLQTHDLNRCKNGIMFKDIFIHKTSMPQAGSDTSSFFETL